MLTPAFFSAIGETALFSRPGTRPIPLASLPRFGAHVQET
jgi:hypothetical protein